MTPERANELNRDKALDNGNDLTFPQKIGIIEYHGLTKREYMATQLMAAGLASGRCSPEEAVERAIKGTDLLLIELNKTR